MNKTKKIKSLVNKTIVRSLPSVYHNGVTIDIAFSNDGNQMVFSCTLHKEASSSYTEILKNSVYFDKDLIRTSVEYKESEDAIVVTYHEDLMQLNYARFTYLLDEFSWVASKQKETLLRLIGGEELEFVYFARN
jgi:hypothetical protein